MTKEVTPIEDKPLTPPTQESNGGFALPEKSDDIRRALSYLSVTRGIDRDIIWDNMIPMTDWH